MDSVDYVLNHNFGYGREPEIENLIKLDLRNFEDVKAYIEWTIREVFSADVDKQNIVCFWNNNKKVQVIIEKL